MQPSIIVSMQGLLLQLLLPLQVLGTSTTHICLQNCTNAPRPTSRPMVLVSPSTTNRHLRLMGAPEATRSQGRVAPRHSILVSLLERKIGRASCRERV